MELTVLAVPGCPGARLLRERLEKVLGRRSTVAWCEIADHEEAARLGMCGSPTLLVDGVDPFAAAGQEPSLSCRLYGNDDAHPADAVVEGAPSVERLRAVLRSGRQPW